MKRLILVLFALLAVLPAFPVQADTPDPDSSPTLENIRIYKHLIEDDDFLAVVPYHIPYASQPDLSIDKTYIFQFLDPDTMEQMGVVLAYPYFEGGYGDGVVSFYFSADDAPAWNEQYIITITQNPSAFDDPETWNFTVSLSDYSSFDTQSENQQLLKDRVIELAQQLTTSWSIELLEQSDSGTVLSSYGEAYFRNAIRGIQTMSPELFYVVISNVDLSKRSWDYTFAEYLTSTFNDTWVWSSMSGFAGLWGLDTNTAMGFVVFGIAILLFTFVGFKFKQTGPAYLFFSATLVWGSLMGWFSPILHALLAFGFVLAGSTVLFLNRA